MSYIEGECNLSFDGRREEADRIIQMLHGYELRMSSTEQEFLIRMQDGPVSRDQLFWLRDIKDKYL